MKKEEPDIYILSFEKDPILCYNGFNGGTEDE